MKRPSLFLSLLVFIMLAAPAYCQGRDHPEPVLGVDAFMRNVDRHQGPVRVQGVVSVISEKDQTLGLIDAREFQECGVTTCATLQLPVRWAGVMPAVADTVRVAGEVKEINGKLLFVARTLEKTEPLVQGAK